MSVNKFLHWNTNLPENVGGLSDPHKLKQMIKGIAQKSNGMLPTQIQQIAEQFFMSW